MGLLLNLSVEQLGQDLMSWVREGSRVHPHLHAGTSESE